MKKLILSVVGVSLLLSGCTEMTEIQKQEQIKVDNAQRVFEQTQVPTISKSLERENIRQRIMVSNDPATLQWIYPMSAGRVIGRFPVKGKVTSGNKRLTKSDQYVMNQGYTEAPDEMGTYGSSGEYIFWFDPAGRIHQHRGDYFVSPVPYKIEEGFGTISTELDEAEEKRTLEYKKQIEESNQAIADAEKAEAEAKAREQAEYEEAQKAKSSQ